MINTNLRSPKLLTGTFAKSWVAGRLAGCINTNLVLKYIYFVEYFNKGYILFIIPVIFISVSTF